MELEILELLREMLSNFLALVPNFFLALLTFIIGWIVSKLVAKFLLRILKTIGADKLADKLNEIEIIHKTNFKLVPSVLLSRLAYYILLFIFVIAAVDVNTWDAAEPETLRALNRRVEVRCTG